MTMENYMFDTITQIVMFFTGLADYASFAKPWNNRRLDSYLNSFLEKIAMKFPSVDNAYA